MSCYMHEDFCLYTDLIMSNNMLRTFYTPISLGVLHSQSVSIEQRANYINTKGKKLPLKILRALSSTWLSHSWEQITQVYKRHHSN